MPPAPQARYLQGQEIEVDVVLTAHHKGHFEFSACPIAPGGVATASCFAQFPLTYVSDSLYQAPKDNNYPYRAYIAPLARAIPDSTSSPPGVFYRFRFKLPSNLSGELILLQWHYYTANSCTYPGYASYPFPSSWGNMQDNLGLCTNIPPDGNGVPGKCHLTYAFFFVITIKCILYFPDLQSNFGIVLKSQFPVVRLLLRHQHQFQRPLRLLFSQRTLQFNLLHQVLYPPCFPHQVEHVVVDR
jgi:hypothetical protein